MTELRPPKQITSKPLRDVLDELEGQIREAELENQMRRKRFIEEALRLAPPDVSREAALAAIERVMEEAARIVKLGPDELVKQARKQLAWKIYQASHLTGSFKLRSGTISNEYFDKYLFESRPALLKEIANGMAALIPPETEVLAGLEMGAIPIATAISLKTGLPAAFVRKNAKDYGTSKFAEGAEVKNKQVCIIEDVVTTGGQIVLSAKDLKKIGAKIKYVLCVIERDPKSREILGKEGLELRSLFTMEELTASQG